MRRLQFSDWSAHVKRIRALGREWTVRESTAQRLWVAMRGSDVMEDHVETTGGSCSAVLRYSAPDLSHDTAEQIIASRAPVRPR